MDENLEINIQRKNECEEIIKNLYESSPKIIQLWQSIKHKNPIINCRSCSNEGIEGNARAFLVDGGNKPLQIVICTNRNLNKNNIEESLTHELVHAYDFINSKCNFSTCEGLAYTEVRAAREGECANTLPIPWLGQWLKKECIIKHATRSTSSIFPEKEASKCVNKVLDDAINDISPFI